ncbi:MAG: NUDIX domain-containing protein [bacterium]|nr:NUDIX domain-containing protein [bacterium]
MENKKEWKREISAGGVVYKKQADKIFVLLIKPSGATNNKEKQWTFPKGLLDGQVPETAALREVKEEGGVIANIIEKLGSIKYSYKWEGENIFKIVTFYLMEYVSGDPKDHDHEVAEAKWVEIVEVENMLTYPGDKETFEKALVSLRGSVRQRRT